VLPVNVITQEIGTPPGDFKPLLTAIVNRRGMRIPQFDAGRSFSALMFPGSGMAPAVRSLKQKRAP
jgi:hypothetical protein